MAASIHTLQIVTPPPHHFFLLADLPLGLILIRQKALVGHLPGNHKVYKITKIAVIPLSEEEPQELELEVCIRTLGMRREMPCLCAWVLITASLSSPQTAIITVRVRILDGCFIHRILLMRQRVLHPEDGSDSLASGVYVRV